MFAARSGTAPVTVTADDGTCPSGTVGSADLDAVSSGAQDAVTMAHGSSVKGRVSVKAISVSFATPLSPLRCTAFLMATYTGPGGDVTNDLTEFSVTVFDRNDL
jgi:hypothetical protein